MAKNLYLICGRTSSTTVNSRAFVPSEEDLENSATRTIALMTKRNLSGADDPETYWENNPVSPDDLRRLAQNDKPERFRCSGGRFEMVVDAFTPHLADRKARNALVGIAYGETPDPITGEVLPTESLETYEIHTPADHRKEWQDDNRETIPANPNHPDAYTIRTEDGRAWTVRDCIVGGCWLYKAPRHLDGRSEHLHAARTTATERLQSDELTAYKEGQRDAARLYAPGKSMAKSLKAKTWARPALARAYGKGFCQVWELKERKANRATVPAPTVQRVKCLPASQKSLRPFRPMVKAETLAQDTATVAVEPVAIVEPIQTAEPIPVEPVVTLADLIADQTKDEEQTSKPARKKRKTGKPSDAEPSGLLLDAPQSSPLSTKDETAEPVPTAEPVAESKPARKRKAKTTDDNGTATATKPARKPRKAKTTDDNNGTPTAEPVAVATESVPVADSGEVTAEDLAALGLDLSLFSL